VEGGDVDEAWQLFGGSVGVEDADFVSFIDYVLTVTQI
jgi:hypothetical protein